MKNQFKKILGILLVSCLIILVLPSQTHATDITCQIVFGDHYVTIQIDETSTITDLKNKIASNPDLNVQTTDQKLSFNGSILKDGTTLSENAIVDNSTITLTELPKEKSIMLSTDRINTVNWDNLSTSDKVYLGVFNNTPIPWVILDEYASNTNVLNEKFLLSQYAISENITFDTNSDQWQGSDAQKWITETFEPNTFSMTELKLIVETTKSDAIASHYALDWGASSLATEQIFFLSATEASTYINGTNGSPGLTAKKLTNPTESAGWWLRSPSDISDLKSGAFSESGSAIEKAVDETTSVRPAFNLDSEAILFVSDSATGKQTTHPGTLTAISENSVTEWKITTKDDAHHLASALTADKLDPNENIEIVYKGASTGHTLSSMILDRTTEEVLHYGNLANNTELTGTVTVTLPDNYDNTIHKLVVFTETLNGTNKTDYASELVEVVYETPLHDYTHNINTANLYLREGTEFLEYSTDNITFIPYTGKLTVEGATISNTIQVQSGSHDITLAGVNIDVSDNDNSAAIDIQKNATANISLVGSNTLSSGKHVAGLVAQEDSDSIATVHISGSGSLVSTGGDFASGIGGNSGKSHGNITIESGFVTAIAGAGSADWSNNQGAAGIGTGIIKSASLSSATGTITISGGHVTAIGTETFGVGSSNDAPSGKFSTGDNGSAVIYTNGLSDQSSTSNWSGIIFQDSQGSVYSNPSIKTSLEVPNDYTLDIPISSTLNLQKSITLTIKGEVFNEGTITNNGTINIEDGLLDSSLGKFEGNLPNGETYIPPILNVTSIAELEEITVLNGGTLPELPRTVTVTLNDTVEKNLQVTWDTSSFDSQKPGFQTINGDLTLEGTDTNTNELKAILNITVGKSSQAITIRPVTGKEVGDKPFTLQVDGHKDSYAVIFSVESGSAVTISGDQATIVEAGTVTVKATAIGDMNYDPSTATIDITIAEENQDPVTYPVLDGNDQKVNAGEKTSITIRFDGDFEKFVDLSRGSYTLTRDVEYTAKAGSVIATLDPDYVATLPVGEHTFTAEFTDGTGTANLVVEGDGQPSSDSENSGSSSGTGSSSTSNGSGTSNDSPSTGDDSTIFTYLTLLLLSLVATGIILIHKKKRT